MDYFQAVKNRNFSFLWGAQILSQVAQNLLNFALIIQVFSAASGTRFANISVSLLVLAFGLPSVIFAAAAGARVDRWDRRLVLIFTNILRAVLVLGYLTFEHNLLVVLVLSFTISTITQFFMPAESATVPAIVPRNLLLSANSLMVFSLYTSFIVGYSVAAPLIQSLGDDGPYITTSVMFGLAAVLVCFLPKQKRIKGFVERQRPSLFEEVTSNFRLIRSDRWLSTALRQLTITQAIVCIILSLGPALSLALLHRPLQQASNFLIIPAGIGMVVGVAIVTHIIKRWSKIAVMEIGLMVAGLMLLLLGLSGMLYRTYDGHVVPIAIIVWTVATLVFTLGMLNAIISATAQTVLQENSSEENRGKIFGALNMFINSAATFPILLTGVLADLLSVTEVVMLMGAGVIMFASWQLRRMVIMGRRSRQTI